MILGYARVSTDGQSLDVQVKKLRAVRIWCRVRSTGTTGASEARFLDVDGIEPVSPIMLATR
jgi:DNA invertase Pin-like site-specific DNA recombinase